MYRHVAASALAILGCALPPPFYESFAGTQEGFEIAKSYCLDVTETQLRFRGASASEDSAHDSFSFDVCMSQFGWSRANRGEPTQSVIYAQPVFRGQ